MYLPVIPHEVMEVYGVHLAQGGRPLFLVGTCGVAIALLAGLTVHLRQLFESSLGKAGSQSTAAPEEDPSFSPTVVLDSAGSMMRCALRQGDSPGRHCWLP